jgi:hypothetical protein
MRKAWRDPVHVAEVLKQERELEPVLFGPKSDEELRAAARSLGIEDHLPDPQLALPIGPAA